MYTAQAISGYLTPILHIAPNAMPNQDESTNPDQFWRGTVTIRQLPSDDLPMPPATFSFARFLFLYEGSAYGLSMSQECQVRTQVDSACPVQGLLPATEPSG